MPSPVPVLLVLTTTFGCATVAASAPPTCGPGPLSFEVLGVRALKVARPGFPAHVPHEEAVGAILTVRAEPGQTAQRLQALVDCHLARTAAHRQVQARVRAGEGRFFVELQAPHAATVAQVLALAQLPNPGVPR